MSFPAHTSPADAPLIAKVHEYVRDYMSSYDASHDINHIHRVLSLARRIAFSEDPEAKTYDPTTITLSALLHDVGDRKYLKAGEDASRLVYSKLKEFGAEEGLAEKVQTICSGVSYSSETKNPAHVVNLLNTYPDLAPVQDADRLDAIGAVGIARCFTFGGAKGARSMQDSVDHFVDKLEKLEGMMKTETGKKWAAERTLRLKTVRGWWEEEVGMVAADEV